MTVYFVIRVKGGLPYIEYSSLDLDLCLSYIHRECPPSSEEDDLGHWITEEFDTLSLETISLEISS